MKTLYVSDLDGTLLRSDETISEYTSNVINRLTAAGIMFTYATARSFITSKKVTEGLDAKIPLIVYNGAFIIDNLSGEILFSSYFNKDITELFYDLFENNIYPIVYSYIDGIEKFSFIWDKCTRGMKTFINSRKGDNRINPTTDKSKLIKGKAFYITCIDEPEKLEPLYEKYKGRYSCVYQQDIYSKEQWLEIMPLTVSKANAIKHLKEYCKCDRLVVFGDGKNDIDMFKMADECYAVENAVKELKEIATGVIKSNNEDGVAKWLEANICFPCK